MCYIQCDLLKNCSAVTSPVVVSWAKTLKNPGRQNTKKARNNVFFCHSFWWGKTIFHELWLFWKCNFPLYPKADSPRLKSAIQSGLSRKPSPGLEGEIGGENEALFLLQSKSWSREGSKSGVSSNSILQYLFRRSNQTGTSTHTPIKVNAKHENDV